MRLPLILLLFATCHAAALEVRDVEFEGARMMVVAVDLRTDNLGVFLNDEAGRPLKTFARLEDYLKGKGRRLLFATNAGMYERDYSAVGLFIEERRTVHPLNLRNAEGNFYLKPNGVFLVGASGARIVDAAAFPKVKERVRIATQSGPLLVLGGRLHRAFLPGSDSRLIRNGVGVKDRHTVLFALAETPVNFHTFARFFRDELGCRDALFLDGSVSSLFLAAPNRSDRKIDLGPMIGVTVAR